ncbi:MAG: DUF1810 family protein, partial [Bacteroidales bacterium]
MSHDLQRFKDAQQGDFDAAIAELRAGRKQTHWIWYVFPQLRGLGSSRMSSAASPCVVACSVSATCWNSVRDETSFNASMCKPIKR